MIWSLVQIVTVLAWLVLMVPLALRIARLSVSGSTLTVELEALTILVMLLLSVITAAILIWAGHMRLQEICS